MLLEGQGTMNLDKAFIVKVCHMKAVSRGLNLQVSSLAVLLSVIRSSDRKLLAD